MVVLSTSLREVSRSSPQVIHTRNDILLHFRSDLHLSNSSKGTSDSVPTHHDR